MTSAPRSADVAILGGGLAGLCLALQLRQRDPAIRVTVLERNRHPVREAAFKVGESTVEIGAHYFANVLGLREHLDSAQLRKFGFRFFFSEGRGELDRCTELGVSQALPTPSWQIDRGRFENFLGARARALGVEFLDGATVRAVDLSEHDEPHAVRFEHHDASHELAARWVVDASGRAGLLKRKLGLEQANDHDVNAVWWRVEGHIDPDHWSTDAAWRDRCTASARWRSTNHMCGPGYWLWLIPLASGSHSLGIVCDAGMHPLDTMNSHDKAMAWLHRHQPGVAAVLEDGRHPVQDFRFLRNFSYGCRELFSAQRWAITGEAGLFLDPFYSPGSDFIAIGNQYICELVAAERGGQRIAAHAAIYQQLYFSFYESTLTLYQDQYPLFGDAQVMPLKVIWDYTYYWSLLAPLYIGGKISRLPVLARLRAPLERATTLNAGMQVLLRDWGRRNAAAGAGAGPKGPLDARNLDQYRMGWFRALNRGINDQLDDDAFVERIHANVALMDRLAAEMLAHARGCHPGLEAGGIAAADPTAPPLLAPPWYGEVAAVA